MDILSDVIAAVRTGHPGGARVHWHAPWGRRFPDQPGAAGFLVVVQGGCWLLRQTAPPLRLGPGDILLSPHGDGYVLADTPDSPVHPGSPDGDGGTNAPSALEHGDATTPATVTLCGGYHLDPGRTHPLLRELPPVVHVQARTGDHRELQAVIELLAAELDGDRLGAGIGSSLTMDLMLLFLLRSWFESRSQEENVRGWAAALADPAVRRALDAIHHDPARPWTVRELAEVARLSRAAFSRRFATLTGQPPLRYLTWWRMALAAGLLRDTDESLAAVASRVGYGSEFAFAHAFKRHHEVAPGRFRRHIRSGSHPAQASAHAHASER